MPRLASCAVAVLAALLLGGCAQMTALQQETARTTAVAVPTAWTTAATTIKPEATTQALETWWRQLGDATLDQLIADAMNAAPDLRTAQARLRQARATRDLAVANLWPSLGASASVAQSASGNSGGQTVYAAGFDAAWEPSIFGGLRDARSGAEADAAAAAATMDATRVSLAAEVALNYVTLRSYQQRRAIAADNVASMAETLAITEWRAEAGLATTLDVEQARTSLEQSKSTIPSFDSGYAEAENRLALLTGRVPGALKPTLLETKALPAAPDAIAVGIPADALRQRPDVRAAELTLQAETARSAQREADRYPSLNLSGSWGWQSFAASGLGASANIVRTLAGSLAGTLFDGGRIRSRIAVQDAVQEAALIAYEKSILTALEDVENALAGYAAGRARVSTRRRAADSANKAASLSRLLYQAGAVDFQKVLDTDRTRLSAEDGLATAEADLLTAVIRIYKALGGGWHAAEATPDQKS
jgi:NodT family efflux transporter outer membrane factor (OMF) lipoprotein